MLRLFCFERRNALSILSILKLALLALLIVALFFVPLDLDLSVGNKNNDNIVDTNEPGNSNTDNDNDEANDGNENNGTDDGNGEGEGGNVNENDPPVPSVVTEAHELYVYCETCQVREKYTSDRFICLFEDYGSIGFYVGDIYCSYCNTECGAFDVSHNYVDGINVCTAEGCGIVCDHTFDSMAIGVLVPYDERFSMFDHCSLTGGDSSVYEGVCTICGKQGL